MTTLEPYAEYGYEADRWLNVLPAHWGLGRLGHVARAWPSNVDKHSVDGETPVRLCNYTDVYKNERISASMDFMVATATPEQIKRFRLRVGDTLLTKDSETADDIGVPAFVEHDAEDLLCGYHLAIVRGESSRVHPRYLYWVLASQPTLRQWAVLAAGVTRVGIRSSDLTKITIPRPPVGEQRLIADYLERETRKIDHLIAKQQQLIETLRERRLALLSEVFAPVLGRGGDRLKWSVREVDNRAGASWTELPLMSVSIAWGVKRRDEVTADDSRAEDLSTYKLCEPGELVINRMRAFQGALGVADAHGVTSPDYAVLRVKPHINAHWLAALMRTRLFVAEMTSRIRGIGGTEGGSVRTPRINVDDLLDIRVKIPNLADQNAMLSAVDQQTAKIDLLISKAEHFVELARERRAALITAAVTGQVDVRSESSVGEVA